MAVMQTYRGIVHKGRIQITPPTDLPEGSEVYIVVTESSVIQEKIVNAPYINPDRIIMLKEQALFDQILPELLTQYKDQYIALYQGEMIDHDTDKVTLVKRLDLTHPEKVVLVKKVTTEPEPILHMPSPRLVQLDVNTYADK